MSECRCVEGINDAGDLYVKSPERQMLTFRAVVTSTGSSWGLPCPGAWNSRVCPTSLRLVSEGRPGRLGVKAKPLGGVVPVGTRKKEVHLVIGADTGRTQGRARTIIGRSI